MSRESVGQPDRRPHHDEQVNYHMGHAWKLFRTSHYFAPFSSEQQGGAFVAAV